MRTIKTIIVGTLILLVALIIIVFIGAATAQPEPVLYPGCTYLSHISSPFDTNPRLPGFAAGDVVDDNLAPCQLWTVEPTSTPVAINPTATQYAPTSTPQGLVTLCHKPGQNQVTIEVDAHAVQAHLDHGDYLGECQEWIPTNTPAPPPTEEATSTPEAPPEK